MLVRQQKEQIGTYIDAVIKMIPQNIIEPRKILNHLLLDYIAKHSNRYSLSDKKEKCFSDVQLAKKLCKLLSHSSPCDPILAVIYRLNICSSELNQQGALSLLLSGFFSIYEFYRSKFTNDLSEKIVFKDIWNDYISRWIDLMVWDMK